MANPKAVFTECKKLKMKAFQTIRIAINHHVATIWLSRPEKRNAIDSGMAVELREALHALAEENDVRALVLRGEGSTFCAGADLNWVNNNNLPQDLQPGFLLPALFKTMFYFPKPLIVVVHGKALGGALGLLVAGDFVLACHDACFAFTEVKLGLVPATISPFVVRRIGEFKARQLMLKGASIGAKDALQAGLVDVVAPASAVEDELENLCLELQKNGPEAMRTCKKMLLHVSENKIDDNLLAYTSEILENIKRGNEAREGMNAFLEKRDAVWKQK